MKADRRMTHSNGFLDVVQQRFFCACIVLLFIAVTSLFGAKRLEMDTKDKQRGDCSSKFLARWEDYFQEATKSGHSYSYESKCCANSIADYEHSAFTHFHLRKSLLALRAPA